MFYLGILYKSGRRLNFIPQGCLFFVEIIPPLIRVIWYLKRVYKQTISLRFLLETNYLRKAAKFVQYFMKKLRENFKTNPEMENWRGGL